MYATYDYYLNVYGGDLDNDQFDLFLKRAEKEIDRVTFGRLKPGRKTAFCKLCPEDNEAVQYATCKLVDKLYNIKKSGADGAGGRKLASVSNDGYSESYTYDTSGSGTNAVQKDILSTAIENLPYWMIELDTDWRLP